VRSAGAVLVLLTGTLFFASPGAQAAEPEALRISGGPYSATDPNPVSLDANLYVPEQTPAPAVVIAHGFGGDKNGASTQAEKLTEAGFVVLTYSARGFGDSTGLISVNSPEFEVADARALIDFLSTRVEVTLDADGDPRVGFTGGSYGGALSLMVAGYDNRVDALASDITWNDLETSLFGQSVSESDQLGAYKDLWTGFFFSVGLANPDGSVTECGRFSPDWCKAYTESAATATVTPASAALMRASSPITITNRITVPALISGGQADSLFPLAQTNANAEQIMAANPQTPVSVVWHGMGHDGGINEQERLESLITQWFAKYLMQSDVPVASPFEVTLPSGAISTQNTRPDAVVLTGPDYPGIFGSETELMAIAGPPQKVLSPAGASPATITSLPGIGGAIAGNLGSLVGSAFPGQSAFFQTQPLAAATQIIGSSRVDLNFSSPTVVTDAVFFASMQVVASNGRATIPQGLVAPIRFDQLGPNPTTVTVDLPAIALSANAGDSLRLVVSTTDMAYRMPLDQRIYSVELASPGIALPIVSSLTEVQQSSNAVWLLAIIPVVAVVWLILFVLRPRGSRAPIDSGEVDIPVVISGLSKTYKGGYQAVSDVSFEVPPGVVLGLLGPNGAGKTTTMRMLMGLIAPTEGSINVFGHPIYFGAPILSRVGALVEGAGFLPHLSGRENLELYWRASGRAGDSYLEEVLEIADLGSAIDRKVKAYSQGMRQRLGIAQAMMGKPDLLVLDEPTNGLDPPQIKAMRDVMKNYAATGRTVIVSSHMLSEVEQTCSHVVVMHRGRLVAVGEVEDLLAGKTGGRLEDVFLEMIGDDLTIGKY
jgi:ABC-2 type transport system ATP-binding protein